MSNLILYTTADGRAQIQLRANDKTVWLTQREMAQLFAVSTDNVGLHLKNIFADEELDVNSVTEESSVTAADGKKYSTKLYDLEAILAVGYRVRSPRGSAVSKLITNDNNKLETYKTHKKGLMQGIFPHQ